MSSVQPESECELYRRENFFLHTVVIDQLAATTSDTRTAYGFTFSDIIVPFEPVLLVCNLIIYGPAESYPRAAFLYLLEWDDFSLAELVFSSD